MGLVIALSGWRYSGKDTVAAYLVDTFLFRRLGFADVLKDEVARQYGIQREWLDIPEFKEIPLRQYPVDPKDPFSRMIANAMIGEFVSDEGRKINPSSADAEVKSVLNSYIDRVDYAQKAWEFANGKLFWTPRALAILEGSVKRSVNSNHWVAKVAEQMNPNGGLYVISDMRFRSEAAALRSYLPGARIVTVRIDRHAECPSVDPSERDLDNFNFDYRINNMQSENRTLAELKQQVSDILSREGYGMR